MAKGTGIIMNARKLFECETLLIWYNALIFPHVTYGIHVSSGERRLLFIYIDYI